MRYSPAELRADAAIHVVGFSLGLAACVALVVVALPSADSMLHLSLGLYGGGLMSMLGFSALYNLSDGVNGREAVKEWLRRFDHAAIFLMIAGTYSPFTLIAIGGAWGIGIFAFVWAVAIAGVVLKLLQGRRLKWLSLSLYLLLGWTVLVALDPFVVAVSGTGLALLVAGGLLYSIGTVFHLWESLPFQNAIWHAFVLAAAGCHYAAVFGEIAIRA